MRLRLARGRASLQKLDLLRLQTAVIRSRYSNLDGQPNTLQIIKKTPDSEGLGDNMAARMERGLEAVLKETSEVLEVVF